MSFAGAQIMTQTPMHGTSLTAGGYTTSRNYNKVLTLGKLLDRGHQQIEIEKYRDMVKGWNTKDPLHSKTPRIDRRFTFEEF
jgi:hypothetical protein